MSRWFRHYAGMMRDEKMVSVAIKSKQSIERVLWVWGAILESATEIDDGGRYTLDEAEVAYFLRSDEGDISSIVAALSSLGRIADGFVVKWGDRQFQSDRSRDRVAAFRQRKRAQTVQSDNVGTLQNVGVTLLKRYGNAPETETETETDIPLAKANGAAPNSDKVFWDGAKGYIGAGAGGLINKLCGEYGREAVSSAITTAMLASPQPPDRKAYLIGILRKGKARAVDEIRIPV